MITRPAQDAEATAALVAALGWEPVVCPVLRLHHVPLSVDGTFDAVLVASRNAIPSLPRALCGTPVLAVGSATAACARAAGFTHVDDADGDARALLALVQRTMPQGTRLLQAHGAGQGGALADALGAAGYAVTRRVAYETLAADRFPETGRAALNAGRVGAAMFLSGETARAFTRLLPTELHPRLRAADALVIGAAVEKALAPLPWGRVRVSVRPTLDEVLALL